MSGTSLDGIDVALVRTDGEAVVERGPSRTCAYSAEQQAQLRAALAEAKGMTERTARPGALAAVEAALTAWHAEAVEAFLLDNGLKSADIDVAGFHGQTVLHRPERRLTVQLGDGPLLARRLGIKVVHDMRAADVAAGGEGAPREPVYHRALAVAMKERPLCFLNIGGVANATWVGRDGGLMAFDTGPGNALINDWCERHTAKPYDADGALAASGRLDVDVHMKLARHPYFERPIPKSLDRNSFDASCLEGLSAADGAATLTHFTATSIARSGPRFPETPALWVVCGGGRHNPTLMREIRRLLEPLGQQVVTAEAAGFDGDAMEAEAWAYLAVRSLSGLPLTFPGTTGVAQAMTGGVVASPFNQG